MSNGNTAKDIPIPRAARRRQESYIREVTRAPAAAPTPSQQGVTARDEWLTGPQPTPGRRRIPSTLSLASGRASSPPGTPAHLAAPAHLGPGRGADPGTNVIFATARIRPTPPPSLRPVSRGSTVPPPIPLDARHRWPHAARADGAPPLSSRLGPALWSERETTVRRPQPSAVDGESAGARAGSARPSSARPSSARPNSARAREDELREILDGLYAETQYERQLVVDGEDLPTAPGHLGARTQRELPAADALGGFVADEDVALVPDEEEALEESFERARKHRRAMDPPAFMNRQLDHAVQSYRAAQKAQVDQICRHYPAEVRAGEDDVWSEPKNDPAAWRLTGFKWDDVDTEVQPDQSRAALIVMTRRRDLSEARQELQAAIRATADAMHRTVRALARVIRALFDRFSGRGQEDFTAAGGEGTEAWSGSGRARVRPGTGS